MKPRGKATIVAVTALAAALVSGGVASAANWFVADPQSTIKNVRTVTMPGFDTGPTADLNAKKKSVTVRWVAQKLVKGERVQRYIVRRYDTGNGAKIEVCGADVVTTTCKDADVPVGAWAYTVQAVQYRWTGPESPRSGVVTIEPEPAAVPTPSPAATIKETPATAVEEAPAAAVEKAPPATPVTVLPSAAIDETPSVEPSAP